MRYWHPVLFYGLFIIIAFVAWATALAGFSEFSDHHIFSGLLCLAISGGIAAWIGWKFAERTEPR